MFGWRCSISGCGVGVGFWFVCLILCLWLVRLLGGFVVFHLNCFGGWAVRCCLYLLAYLVASGLRLWLLFGFNLCLRGGLVGLVALFFAVCLWLWYCCWFVVVLVVLFRLGFFVGVVYDFIIVLVYGGFVVFCSLLACAFWVVLVVFGWFVGCWLPWLLWVVLCGCLFLLVLLFVCCG